MGRPGLERRGAFNLAEDETASKNLGDDDLEFDAQSLPTGHNNIKERQRQRRLREEETADFGKSWTDKLSISVINWDIRVADKS